MNLTELLDKLEAIEKAALEIDTHLEAVTADDTTTVKAHGQVIKEFHSVWNKRNAEIQPQTTLTLIKALRIAREALEFYGDKELWSLTGGLHGVREMARLKPWAEGLHDLENFEIDGRNSLEGVEKLTLKIGGKHARAALAELDKLAEDVK